MSLYYILVVSNLYAGDPERHPQLGVMTNHIVGYMYVLCHLVGPQHHAPQRSTVLALGVSVLLPFQKHVDFYLYNLMEKYRSELYKDLHTEGRLGNRPRCYSTQ